MSDDISRRTAKYDSTADLGALGEPAMRGPMLGIFLPPLGQDMVPEGTPIDYVVPEFEDIGELCKRLVRPTILPFGSLRAVDEASVLEASQVLEPWVSTEVARRLCDGRIDSTEALVIQQALVVFPDGNDTSARVYLNHEVHPVVRARTKYRKIERGAALGPDDVVDLRDLTFDGVDIHRDGFIWLRPGVPGVVIYFSFLACAPSEGTVATRLGQERRDLVNHVQNSIAQDLLRGWFQDAFLADDSVQSAMAEDGWFPSPLLLPEAWRRMCAAYADGRPEDATAVAAAVLDERRLMAALEGWQSREPFAGDGPFLSQGVKHYLAGDCLSAISVLLPRIEGLIRRARAARGLDSTRRHRRLFGELSQLSDPGVRDGWLLSRMRDGLRAYLMDYFGKDFHPDSPSADTTRGRHAHVHGMTSALEYDQRFALQILLTIDALFFATAPAEETLPADTGSHAA